MIERYEKELQEAYEWLVSCVQTMNAGIDH